MCFITRKLPAVMCLLLAMGVSSLQAQEVTNTTGGNASGSGGSSSYSVGQIVYTINTGATGTVAQGVQQPYDISIVTEVKEAGGINLSCRVYPNPASHQVILKVENFETENLVYQLFDAHGKLLQTKKAEGTETRIVVEQLDPATYYLKVIHHNNQLKAFKIIKY